MLQMVVDQIEWDGVVQLVYHRGEHKLWLLLWWPPHCVGHELHEIGAEHGMEEQVDIVDVT